MRNLTLALEDDLLLEARKIALNRRTSVNQMVREYLATVVNSETRVHQARSNLKQAFDTGFAEVGGITWSREDLHER